MRIEVRIDSACSEPKLVVYADRMSDEVNAILKRLEEPRVLTGFQGESLAVIDPARVIRAYASNGKVYISTQDGEYTARLKLYELEARLDKARFVRISHSEIVNLQKVKGFDLSFAGTICVSLANGTAVYVSRRYMARIKQVLGL